MFEQEVTAIAMLVVFTAIFVVVVGVWLKRHAEKTMSPRDVSALMATSPSVPKIPTEKTVLVCRSHRGDIQWRGRCWRRCLPVGSFGRKAVVDIFGPRGGFVRVKRSPRNLANITGWIA